MCAICMYKEVGSGSRIITAIYTVLTFQPVRATLRKGPCPGKMEAPLKALTAAPAASEDRRRGQRDRQGPHVPKMGPAQRSPAGLLLGPGSSLSGSVST